MTKVTSSPPSSAPAPEEFDSFSGCLARLFWMAGGNVLLFLVAAKIFSRNTLGLSWLDVLYWLVVAGAVAVRYVDVRYLTGRTANSTPATLRDWARYAAVVLVAASALWALSHLTR